MSTEQTSQPVLTQPSPETAQQRFDRLYITSGEICETYGVSRTSVVNARRRGLLPDPIFTNDGHLAIWERERVTPFLKAWKVNLDARRGLLA